MCLRSFVFWNTICLASGSPPPSDHATYSRFLALSQYYYKKYKWWSRWSLFLLTLLAVAITLVFSQETLYRHTWIAHYVPWKETHPSPSKVLTGSLYFGISPDFFFTHIPCRYLYFIPSQTLPAGKWPWISIEKDMNWNLGRWRWSTILDKAAWLSLT